MKNKISFVIILALSIILTKSNQQSANSEYCNYQYANNIAQIEACESNSNL